MANHAAGPVGGASVAVGTPHPSKKLLPLSVVLERVPVSRARLYQLVASGAFPRQLKVGSRSLWLESEVDAWITALAEQRAA